MAKNHYLMRYSLDKHNRYNTLRISQVYVTLEVTQLEIARALILSEYMKR